MKIEIALTVVLSVLVILGGGGCYLPGSAPLPMPTPYPVIPVVTEVTRMELGRSIATKVGVGVLIVTDHDSYRILSQPRLEALVRTYRAQNLSPSPDDLATGYEENCRRFILSSEPRTAIGVARLCPPAIAFDYGYQPGREYSWLVYVGGSPGNLGLYLVDIRRDLGFSWEVILEGSWVTI